MRVLAVPTLAEAVQHRKKAVNGRYRYFHGGKITIFAEFPFVLFSQKLSGTFATCANPFPHLVIYLQKNVYPGSYLFYFFKVILWVLFYRIQELNTSSW